MSVNDGYWTTKGSEELLKKMVAKYGAVITGVVAKGPFSAYRGGIFQGTKFKALNGTAVWNCINIFIFSGCTDHVFTDHAVVVVGYGTENGVDKIIKNDDNMINLSSQVWITGQSRTPGAPVGGKRVMSGSKGKTEKIFS